jgi:glutathionyl-hydroquinone reductase
MGQMIEGQWHTDQQVKSSSDGKFVRADTLFRNWVTADGSPGPSGEGGFKAEPGRYHLYVSYACPWAHRTMILRRLKKLEAAISVSVVDWFLGKDGWVFSQRDGATPDIVNHKDKLWQVYKASRDDYTGRVSVPVLWDKKTARIVNNESSEIIRMFNSAFDAIGDADVDFYPEHLRGEIDRTNARVYNDVNNGVYKCGFSRSQGAYDEAFKALFESLDWIESLLGKHRYLVGDKLTEADWRLFTTLVRFDPVYFTHFKCNLRRIDDYNNLSNYLRELFQVPGIAGTVNLHHIRNHYYQSHESINPYRIVPGGPEVDFDRPHDRDRFSAALVTTR